MTSRILVLAGLPRTIIISVSFTKLTIVKSESSIESSPDCDLLRVLNGRYKNLSHQKTWQRSNLTLYFRSFELILTTNIPLHFGYETIIAAWHLAPECWKFGTWHLNVDWEVWQYNTA